MSLQSVWQQCCSFFGKDVAVAPVEAQLSSDAGLIPFRELDERLRFTKRLAAALSDAQPPPNPRGRPLFPLNSPE